MAPVKDGMNKKNNHLVDSCVIVERFDQFKMKKKRGRPKKLLAQNKNVPLSLNCDENSVAPNSSSFKPEVNDVQITEEKCCEIPKNKASNKSDKLI